MPDGTRPARSLARCRPGRLGSGRDHRSVPPLPPRHLPGGHRAGPRHRSAHGGAAGRPRHPRLPLLRPARLWQDDVGAHPGPLPQLRPGPHRHPLRHLPLLPGPGHRRPWQPRRRRDRRRQPQRRRRRSRLARARRLRTGPRPLQDLHPRRGPHGDRAGLQRAAQARRGAAGAREVHLRHHRAGEGHRHHPLAHPSLPLPSRPARRPRGLPRSSVPGRGRRDRPRRLPPRGARRRRLRARHPFRHGPAHRRGARRRRRLPAGRCPAGLHRHHHARPVRRRHRGLRRRRRLPSGGPGRLLRARPPSFRRGPAGPAARPARHRPGRFRGRRGAGLPAGRRARTHGSPGPHHGGRCSLPGR